MTRCQYRSQCVRETDTKAAGRQIGDCSRVGNGEKGGQLATAAG